MNPAYLLHRAIQLLSVERSTAHPPMIWCMDDRNGWGNSMFWFNWEHRRVTGHLTPMPVKGDELRCKMESGKVARFLFEEVEYCVDPPDQFFATVKDIGYLVA